jgi:hypothetical protein
MFKLEDLKITLESIKKLRDQWENFLEVNALNLMLEQPKMTFDQAKAAIITKPDSLQYYTKILNLYTSLGSDADSFVAALSEVLEVNDSNVLELNVAKLRKSA